MVMMGWRVALGAANLCCPVGHDTLGQIGDLADAWSMGFALSILGNLSLLAGESGRAESLQQESLALRHSIRDGAGVGRCLDGLALRSSAWRVEPVEILAAESTFFDDTTRFPSGSVALDCALLMRNVPVAWEPLPQLAGPRVTNPVS